MSFLYQYSLTMQNCGLKHHSFESYLFSSFSLLVYDLRRRGSIVNKQTLICLHITGEHIQYASWSAWHVILVQGYGVTFLVHAAGLGMVLSDYHDFLDQGYYVFDVLFGGLRGARVWVCFARPWVVVYSEWCFVLLSSSPGPILL